MRQIILDTETTGLNPKQGHKIIEIGCIEVASRKVTANHYHQYIFPEREVEAEAMAVHGITNEYLADKPVFKVIAQAFVDFVQGAELIIHNAPFDVGFLNHELALVGMPPVDEICTITDTLVMARNKYPGRRNSLDALCKRLGINNAHRELHGALLDSEILAEVYLAMTGGQTAFSFEAESQKEETVVKEEIVYLQSAPNLRVVKANDVELEAHKVKMAQLSKSCGGETIWSKL